MDAADVATRNEERALALFEKQRQQRIAASMNCRDPNKRRKCSDCKRAIGKKRLKAHPCASRCTPCADAIERNRFV